MAEDRPTPPAGPQEEPVLEISSEDLAAETPPPVAAAPPPPAPEPSLPPAPAEPYHDDQEVTFVQEPPTPADPLVPEIPPPPLEVVVPPPVMPAPVPPAPAVEVAPVLPTPMAEPAAPAVAAYQPPAATPAPAPQYAAPTPEPAAPAPAAEPEAYAPAVVPAAAPVMAGDQWYTTSAGTVFGPYSAEDIRAWLRSGQVSWDTQASRGEGDTWRALSQIAEFNPAPAYGAPVGAPVAAAPGLKDKTIAGILGILLGWAGAHHWYLGNYLLAVIYLVLCWTGIPSVLGLVEGIIYLTAPDDRFQRNYNKWFLSGP